MIPIKKADAPASFAAQIADPGKTWLASKGIIPAPPTARHPVPDKFQWNSLWRKCLPDLHTAYKGICAFSGVYIELVVGARTVEHFRSKNAYPGLAFDWDNYRLVCSTLNGRKSDFEDVLDPFELKAGKFRMEFSLGKISPNPKLTASEKAEVQATIKRLGLDDGECRKLRLKYFIDYIKGDISSDYFRRHSPFAWEEARRQKLL